MFFQTRQPVPGTMLVARFHIHARSHCPIVSRGIRNFLKHLFCIIANIFIWVVVCLKYSKNVSDIMEVPRFLFYILMEIHHQLRTGCLRVVQGYLRNFVSQTHAGMSIRKRCWVFHVHVSRAGRLQNTNVFPVLHYIHQTSFCQYSIPNISSVLVFLILTIQAKPFFFGQAKQLIQTHIGPIVSLCIIFLVKKNNWYRQKSWRLF